MFVDAAGNIDLLVVKKNNAGFPLREVVAFTKLPTTGGVIVHFFWPPWSSVATWILVPTCDNWISLRRDVVFFASRVVHQWTVRRQRHGRFVCRRHLVVRVQAARQITHAVNVDW